MKNKKGGRPGAVLVVLFWWVGGVLLFFRFRGSKVQRVQSSGGGVLLIWSPGGGAALCSLCLCLLSLCPGRGDHQNREPSTPPPIATPPPSGGAGIYQASRQAGRVERAVLSVAAGLLFDYRGIFLLSNGKFQG